MAKQAMTSQTRGVDTALLVSTLALMAIGVLMVYSSSAFFAAQKSGDQYIFFRKQLAFAGLGGVMMFIASKIPYRFYHRTILLWLGLVLLLLIAVLIPGVGVEVLGAQRWFNLGGFFVQPSELAKLVIVAYVAFVLAKVKEPSKDFLSSVIKPLVPALLLVGLLLAEPDFGTSVIMIMVIVAMMYVAGTPAKYLMYAAFAGAATAVPLILLFPYRLERVRGFLRGLSFIGSTGDYQDLCYQVRESIISFGSGQLWGVGLGGGKHKMFFLPQAHSDFILATIGQEGGFMMILFIMVLYTVFIYRGFRIAWNSPDTFAGMLAFGLTLMLVLQVFINGGVVTGILPPKGIVLPFISYGGSALVATCTLTGILLQLSRHTAVDKDAQERWRR